jgi:shikimate kinase
MNIAITGMMGSGKSSVGRIVARALNMKFVDTDEIIERVERMSISDIFAKKGEPYFREVEARIVGEVSQGDNYVIACGGGVVLKQENVRHLKSGGVIVNLTASPEVLHERTKQARTRPLLEVHDRLQEFRRIIQEREKFYSNCDFRVQTDNLTQEQTASRIVDFISGVKKKNESS